MIISGLVTASELQTTRNGKQLLRLKVADSGVGEVSCVMFPDRDGDLPDVPRRVDVVAEVSRLTVFRDRPELVLSGGVIADTGAVFGRVSDEMFGEASDLANAYDARQSAEAVQA